MGGMWQGSAPLVVEGEEGDDLDAAGDDVGDAAGGKPFIIPAMGSDGGTQRKGRWRRVVLSVRAAGAG